MMEFTLLFQNLIQVLLVEAVITLTRSALPLALVIEGSANADVNEGSQALPASGRSVRTYAVVMEYVAHQAQHRALHCSRLI